MNSPLSPHLVELVSDAALKSYWRRKALQNFLRRCGIAESFFAGWSPDESKRELLDRLFPLLEKSEKGPDVIEKMAKTLAEQTAFPDLENWEDSGEKIRQATKAVEILRQYLKKRQEQEVSQREKEESRKRATIRQQEFLLKQSNLGKLSEKLNTLASRLGSQAAGYEFQDWFFDLLDHFEVTFRRPYSTDGRQIDGSVTVDGTTYLIELKFTTNQADAPDVDTFYRKVHDKADNTMGIMVSISGYSAVAIRSASSARSPLLLLDHSHIYCLLGGTLSFHDLISRVRRHSSQTGQAYLNAQDF